MKKIFFVGNRTNCLEVIIESKNQFELVETYVLKNSLLENNIGKYIKTGYIIFKNTREEKQRVIEKMHNTEFDIFISNGCPFILPIAEIKKAKPNVIFLNTHPTYLPHLRGRTPLNGVLLLGYNFIGATTHHIDDGIDTGNIIYQEKIALTPDLDQGLIYMISFDYEKIVFKKALEILIKNSFQYKGFKPKEEGTYFNRDTNTIKVNFETDKNELVAKKINSVGLIIQGNTIKLNNGNEYRAHSAQIVTNEYLLNKYNGERPGSLLYEYSDKILVKTIDGILKISYYYGN
jgi:methionyl-tRNA formyltransferase